MNDLDRSETARREIDQLGLNEQWFSKPDSGQQFNKLDLNLGMILVESHNLQAIYDVFAKHGEKRYGEHFAMAQLVCDRDQIDAPVRYWERPYYTDAREHPEKWVRMRELIKEIERG